MLLTLTSRIPRLNNFRSFCSFRNQALDGHEDLVKASDDEKVKRIAQTFLSVQEQNKFYSEFGSTTTNRRIKLAALMAEIRKCHSIPIKNLLQDAAEENHLANYFEQTGLFIDLPYSETVSQWPDRKAVQELIRSKFDAIFKQEDLVLVPGCADGQISMEIYMQSIRRNIPLDIISGDFNEIAMQVGYCTMKAYGLGSRQFRWVKADMTSKSFFEWIPTEHTSHSSHRIVTLIQPCLQEHSLLSLLQNNKDYASETKSPTTIVMPVLLNDPTTEWHKDHQKWVETDQMKQNITEFGLEILRVGEWGEVPQQYFINESSIDKIRQAVGYKNSSNCEEEIIQSKQTRRKICIWEFDPNSERP